MPSVKRTYWGKKYPNIPKLDLIQIQKESWQDFLDRELKETIHAISPIVDYTGNNWQLDLGELSYDPVTITPETAKKKGLNYTLPVRIKATLITNAPVMSAKKMSSFLISLL